MFDDSMEIKDGNKLYPLHLCTSGSEPLPLVFEFWMAELARDHLRLGVYFRAVAIMLQIPGAAKYEWVGDDEENEYETPDLVRASSRDELLGALGECFRRLGAEQLIDQLPDPDAAGQEVSDDWAKLLDKRGKVDNGLLNVVAECLDKLIVRPGLAEITAPVTEPWWQRWRLRT